MYNKLVGKVRSRRYYVGIADHLPIAEGTIISRSDFRERTMGSSVSAVLSLQEKYQTVYSRTMQGTSWCGG